MEPPARNSPWHRRYRRHGNRRNYDGSKGIPIGTRLCRLDWACSSAGFNGRQTETRTHLKAGRPILRRILVVGAHSVLRRARQHPQKYPWLTALLARRPFKVVAVALANKIARIAWALLV